MRREVVGLAALLGLLLISAVVSAVVHPSAQAGLMLATLTVSIAFSMAIAWGAPRQSVVVLLIVWSAAAVLLFAWVALVDSELLLTKSPFLRGPLAWLAHLKITAGRGIAHPNMAGIAAAMLVPGWLAIALGARSRWTRAVTWSLLTLELLVLVLSGSRGGLVAAFAGASTVLIVRYRRAVWLIPATVFAMCVALAGPWGIGDTVVRLLAVGSGNDQGRLPVWEASLRGILESPLTGRGVGSFPVAYARLPGGDAAPNGAHNTFLQVWMDFGLLGLAALLAITALLFVLCLRGPRGDPFAQALTGIAVAWVVISLVESTVIVTWRIAPPWHGFTEVVFPPAFALWGLATAPFMTAKRGGGVP